MVLLGLLLVAVIAPTSLLDERASDSLDVLMSTPLSTRSIVVGKWRGAFRLVPWLAALAAVQLAPFAWLCPDHRHPGGGGPVMWTPAVLSVQDRILAVVIPTAQVLTVGALFTSVGVFLGVLVSKPGRAIAWSVAAYLSLVVGWIWFVDLAGNDILKAGLRAWYATSDDRALANSLDLHEGVRAGSPLVGLSNSVAALVRVSPTPRYVMWRTYGVVVVITGLLAGALLALTVAVFDRRMGRVRAHASASPRGPDPTGSPRKRSRLTPEAAHSPR